MFRISACVCTFFLLTFCVLPVNAQQPAAAFANITVPPIVNFSGVLADVNHKPLTGAVGVTFYLYQESQGGAPLWMETQNVQADKAGHYSVALGSTSSQGLPANVFATGEARWLGVQVQGQEEQPRVLLMSVPYALKALDAETIGGKPASSFMLAPPANSKSEKTANLPPGTITGSGTADYVPLFTGATTIGNSKTSRPSRATWELEQLHRLRCSTSKAPETFVILSRCFPNPPTRPCRFTELPSTSATLAW